MLRVMKSTATPPAPSPVQSTSRSPQKSPPKVDKLPPYRVLLHNDDHNDVVYVAETLVLVTPLGKREAVSVMLAAHTRGVALVCVTHKERAELIRDQLRSRGLSSTIEPAEG